MPLPSGSELIGRCERLGIDTSAPCDFASRMPAEDSVLQERLMAYERYRRELGVMRVAVVSSVISSLGALIAALAALIR